MVGVLSEKLKNAMARILDVPKFERIYGRFRKSYLQNGPIILAYHRVLPDPGEEYPFDEELISADPDSFERQLEFVKRNFNVTNFQRMHEEILSEGKIPHGSLVITFDDGYADNYEIAYPILVKHGLTATIFVTTGHVGMTDLFWFEKVSFYFKTLGSYELNIGSLNFKEHVDENNRIMLRDSLLGILKKVPNQVRENAMAELEALFGEKSQEAAAHHLINTLTWEQIVEMDRGGIEMGSHTVSHPVLSSMEEREIHLELIESKKILEEKLGHEIVSVSYPVGGQFDFNPLVERIAFESGYKFGLSYINGANSDLSKPYALKRVHIERYQTYRRFAAELYFPRLFFP